MHNEHTVVLPCIDTIYGVTVVLVMLLMPPEESAHGNGLF